MDIPDPVLDNHEGMSDVIPFVSVEVKEELEWEDESHEDEQLEDIDQNTTLNLIQETIQVKEEVCDESMESQMFHTEEAIGIDKCDLLELQYKQASLQLQREHDKTNDNQIVSPLELIKGESYEGDNASDVTYKNLNDVDECHQTKEIKCDIPKTTMAKTGAERQKAYKARLRASKPKKIAKSAVERQRECRQRAKMIKNYASAINEPSTSREQPSTSRLQLSESFVTSDPHEKPSASSATSDPHPSFWDAPKMPQKKRSLSSSSKAASKRREIARSLETEEQRQIRLETDRVRHAVIRKAETPEQRLIRLENDRERHAAARRGESLVQTKIRKEKQRVRQATSRKAETLEQTHLRLQDKRARQTMYRTVQTLEQRRLAGNLQNIGDFQESGNFGTSTEP